MRAGDLPRALGLLACLLALAACGRQGAAPREADAASSLPTVYGRAPSFRLADQDGQPFDSASLQGQVWIANFMFTRCSATCPVQTARLVVLQGLLATHPKRAHIDILSISVDPEHDTPEVLKAYTARHAVATDRWRFLTGDRRAIWLLSTVGFRLPAGPDPSEGRMPVGHSARFAVVDRRGRIRGLIDSQAPDAVDETLALLEELVAEPRPDRLVVPPEAADTGWLAERERVQREAAKAWSVEHDFAFRDVRRASRIGFRNRMVDDGGKLYKAVHYDHGNGLAVADVDGDGRLDLYFCTQVGSNRLYRNLGGGRFDDITEKAGVALRDVVGVTASFADTDNDGDPDLYVTSVNGGNRFFVNDGTGTFTDATKAAGLTHRGHSSAAVFFDYDRDGLLDLFLCNVGRYTESTQRRVVDDSTTQGGESGAFRYPEGTKDGFSGHLHSDRSERSILYRNRGGNRFEDVTAAMFLEDRGWAGAATPIDGNADGWPDLYVLNMQGHDAYYENEKGVAFRRRSREVFPKTPWGAMGVKVFDQDGDGLLDLYLTDMHSDMSQLVAPTQAAEKAKSEMLWPERLLRSGGNSIFGNALFRRAADGTYTEVSDAVGAETFWPWGVSVGDLNADGRLDAFVTGGMSYPFRYGINSVLLGTPEGFVDAEFVLGVEPRQGDLFAPWFDLDCGGADRGHKDCAGTSAPAIVWAPRSSRASVLIDLDDDGDLDIVTNDFNTEPLVLASDLAQRRPVHWIGVRLRGHGANRDGLGAVVRVTAGGRTQVQVHDGQTGYLSQSALPLYFGLGAAEAVERIEVRWPGGVAQSVVVPEAIGRVLEIEQPAAK